MNKKLTFTIFILSLFTILKVWSQSPHSPVGRIFCFYYNWYGNVKENGKNSHWAHPVMKSGPADTTTGFIPGGENLAGNFFSQYLCILREPL